MHKSFSFQCIFSASLPTFRKGVHCTKVLHPLTHAVRAVQCAVRFSTLMEPEFCEHMSWQATHALCSHYHASTVIVLLVCVRQWCRWHG